MNNQLIDQIILKFAELLNQDLNVFQFKELLSVSLKEDLTLGKFIDELIEKSDKTAIKLLKNSIEEEQLSDFVNEAHFPILFFVRGKNSKAEPVIVYNDYSDNIHIHFLTNQKTEKLEDNEDFLGSLIVHKDNVQPELNGKIIFLTGFPLSESRNQYLDDNAEKISPWQRLFRLLSHEQKDIWYIYIYAFVVGIVNLSLPLGIQATISMISGGMIFSSVILLIVVVILGVLIGGGLQVMQLSIVEVLQQRVFAKAAFEIISKITRVRLESLHKYHPPELMNRFFDVITIQKGLPKIFIDIIGALIQIFFGLMLLSFYHPFFLIFGFVLVTVVIAIFYFTSAKGLETSIYESKYKYKIVHWLEEVARTLDAFKTAGNTNLHIQRVDELLNNYLHYRKSHFRVLLTQYVNMVVFKTVVTGGLLILGTLLVVDRQISLGQFVASEVIIILVVGAVEKLIISLETVYDLLTAVDKIAQITDLPLENSTGLRIGLNQYLNGLHLHIQDLKYKYKDNKDYTLKGLSFELQPGESICIAGANDSGKHTLMKILTGVLDSYEGIVAINHLSLHDLNLASLRSVISKNLSNTDIFYGSILDNITMGRSQITYQDVVWAIDNVGLSESIYSLPDGLNTVIGPGGKSLSGSVSSKIILARAVITKPKLLIVSDFSENISRKDKMRILSFLQDKSNGWSLIIISISDDPMLFVSCDKVIMMQKGLIAAQGTYEDLLEDKEFQNMVFKSKEVGS